MGSKITFWTQMRGLLSSIPAACGLMPTARLGTGTANGNTVLKGDQTYGAVTPDMMGTVAMETVFYRRTVFDGPPEVRPLSELKTDLGLAGANTGDITINALASTTYVIDVGTGGTDFNVTTAGSTITLNIPNASATARGLVTTNAQTIGGLKTFRQITIDNTTDVVLLLLKPLPAQTANIQEWENVSGDVKSWITPSTQLFLGAGVSIWNTYTNASNYDSVRCEFVSNVFTIGSYAAGTGTLRDIMVGVTGNKLGFLGTPAIAKPTTAFTAATFAAATGVPVLENSTFDGYTIKQVVAALRALGLLT